MTETKDYYDLLGVPADADERAIKLAYRQQARQCHPDMRPGDRRAEERFKEINEAYQVLGDPELRRAYDARRRRRGPRGRDLEMVVEVSFEDACKGTTRTLQVGERWIEARIPAGVRSGARVRLRGQGGASSSGTAGDLYLVIQMQPHPRFRQVGDDLTIDAAVDFFTAATGGMVQVETLDGPVLLKIPPRTQAGSTFRLAGRGMPRPSRPSERGDLYARVTIVLPSGLSDDELAALRTIMSQRPS